MATRNVSMVITFVAWDTGNNVGKTGQTDSELTLRWVKDGTSSAPDNDDAIGEVDATNCPGIYKITMTATETDCNIGTLCGKSSTSNIVVLPITIQFERLPDADPAANGGLPTVDGSNHINGVQDTLSVNVTQIEGSDATDQINAACDAAIETYGLDHLVSASVAGSDIVDNSIVAKLVSKESTADWDDFVNTTDSLQALRDRGDASWVTGGGGSASAIADAVWDEATSGHTTGGSYGKALSDILTDTAVIGSAGAGLSAVPWNAAWDAEVQSECTDALNAYDPPTKAEMDALWTTDIAEAYAGASETACTPAELLYMILSCVGSYSISGDKITTLKLDESTQAMRFDMDDATNPTYRKRDA
jgi:hypothetical protein